MRNLQPPPPVRVYNTAFARSSDNLVSPTEPYSPARSFQSDTSSNYSYTPMNPNAITPGSPSPHYATLLSEKRSTWLLKTQKRHTKLRIFAWIFGLLVLGGLGFALGWHYTHNTLIYPHANILNGGNTTLSSNSNNSSNSPSSSTSLNLTITPLGVKKSFYGIGYTTNGAQYPWCNTNFQQVLDDVKILSQLTTRLRLYGTDCNQTGLVLSAIQTLNLNMTIIPTVWVDDNSTTYQRQVSTMMNILQNPINIPFIDMVCIGNEVLFRKDITQQELFQRMSTMRTSLSAISTQAAKIPVVTSDLGSNWNSAMIQASDIILANDHPYFAGIKASTASSWTFDFFQTNNLSPATKVNKQAILSEMGWPTGPANESTQAAIPSVDNLIQVLNTFVCQANSKGIAYYWFAFQDAPWAAAMTNSLLEENWGLFDVNRNPKIPISSFPDCISS